MENIEIITKINQNASSISEKDIEDWAVPGLLDHYSKKINYYSSVLYGSSDLARRAFSAHASEVFKKGLYTFIIDKKHWKNGRDIGSYLSSALKNLFINEKRVYQNTQQTHICPGCKYLGHTEYCLLSGNILVCEKCTSEYDRLYTKKRVFAHEAAKIKIHNIFSTHSKKGWGCPECKRFIPDSFVVGINVECIYDDCVWFGSKTDLKSKSHPTASTARNFVELDGTGKKKFGFDDCGSIVFVNLNVKEQTQIEYNVLKDVIETQASRLSNRTPERVIKNKLMYQAFKNVLERQPDDMIRYLVHQKIIGEVPIQSQLFQEFIKLVENNLPFDIIKKGEKKEVYSLLDHDLDLFLGKSEFTTEVSESRIIHNKTKETYIGGRQMRDFGPCFIGYLCDVKNKEGISLLDNVEYYTFANIKLKDVDPGTVVTVEHFRIPSHYEMNGLMYLQRIRKRIVLSVKRRLENEIY